MIQLNELRIGNFVHGSPYNGKITVFNNNQCVIKHKGGIAKFVIEDLQIIPLTEELIIKCGFERQEYNDYRHPVLIGTLTLYEGVAELHISDLYSVWANNLHQLQNLYFILTQEELCVDI